MSVRVTQRTRRLPRGLGKFIRRRKAEIRRNTVDAARRREELRGLYDRVGQLYTTH
ncbi:MAG: hypothetical protein Q8R13_02370 [bacterium]|nr:hypothetical protein [bacterium]MDZ4296526.1 hypothetical protein [Patescibacteria group bacterium]